MSEQEIKTEIQAPGVLSEVKDKQSDAFSWFKPQEQKFVLPKRKAGYLKWLLLFCFMVGLAVTGGYFWYTARLNSSLAAFPKHVVVEKPAQIPELPAGVEPVSSIQASSSGVAGQATTSPSLAELPAKLVVLTTPTGYLNVRQEPSVSSRVLTQVHPEEVYPYTAHQAGWYKIILPGPSEGWVSEQYVKEM